MQNVCVCVNREEEKSALVNETFWERFHSHRKLKNVLICYLLKH